MPSATNATPVDHSPEVEKINPAEMSSAAFDHKRGKRGRNRNRAKPAVGRPLKSIDKNPGLPTPERMAKGDVIVMGAGGYRAQPTIERMRDRGQFDSTFAHINEAMFRAAERFDQLFHESGLTCSVQAQDLNRIVVHGTDAAARYVPQSERAAYARQQFRLAVKLMGWHEAYPHKGAARLVLDVVCYGMSVEDAARKHLGGGRTFNLQIAGMDRLREGLFALAVHWRFC